jgi:filamentous hemagglutinin family protein
MKFTTCFAGTVFLAYLAGVNAASAQVSSDSSLSTTVNSSDGSNFVIENGDRTGNNLFHSFREFSIPTGGSVSFNNAADVQNIFSRVTGGSISNIDGLIRTNGTANLFLLNPSGILFGPNASLNIGGSFIGTTANRILFADGVEFSATTPQGSSLLSISTPIGLQMGQTSGNITVQGNGHRVVIGNSAPANRRNSPIGLQVGSGHTFALIGNEVNFSGGVATVNGSGHLEIGSVSEGQLNLNLTRQNSTGQQWTGDYSAVQQFANINLAQQSLLDASGNQGSIQLQGRNIGLTEGSALLLQNLGAQPARGITIRATEALNMRGTTPGRSQGSQIRIDNLSQSLAGNINVSAGQLSLLDGGKILTATFTPATGSNIDINVSGAIAVDGAAPANPANPSSFATLTYNIGSAGNMTVSTGTLSLLNSANLTSSSFGNGQTGAVQINASDLIEIAGNNPITLTPSALTTGAIRSGNAMNMVINTSRLVVREGGLLGSQTFATGTAGNVIVNASQFVEVRGRGAGSIVPSRIASSAEILDPALQAAFRLPPIPSGDAGALTINTPSLRLADAGFVSVKNDGPGRAGNLQINANTVSLDNQARITAATASGQGGDLLLTLEDDLSLRRNSLISATAGGTGDGGRVQIRADRLNLLSQSQINTTATGSGNAGRLSLQVGRLRLDRGEIQVEATGSGDAGQLTITADMAQLDRSRINATTQTGRGGDVRLTVRDRLQLTRQSTITADAQQSGVSGDIILRTRQTELNNSTISTNVLGTARGGRLSLTGDRLQLFNGAQLSASTGGSGNAGRLAVQASEIDISGVGRNLIPSLISVGTLANSSGAGGDLTVNADRIRINDGGLIGAGTAGSGAAGDVNIRASESIEVIGRSDRGAPSFGYLRNHPSHISASSLTDASAGSVRIQTPVLTVDNGALIEVSGAGRGGAGNLEVTANQINLTDRASLEAQVAGGNRGNITLNASLIDMRRGSQITTNATGSASGGNINLNSNFIIGMENSDIVARAQQGSGGNIAIDTQGLIGLELRPTLTPENDVNASSQLGLNGSINVENPSVKPDSGLIELPAEVMDSSQQIAQACDAAQTSQFVATGRGGIPSNPQQEMTGDRPWSDLRELPAGTSGTSEAVVSPTSALIQEASTWRVNAAGQMELVANGNGAIASIATCAR